MTANSAFLAAMLVLVLVGWLLGELSFLAPYKRLVLGRHLWLIVGVVIVVFLNVFALVYAVTRSLFRKDTAASLLTSTSNSARPTRSSVVSPTAWRRRTESCRGDHGTTNVRAGTLGNRRHDRRSHASIAGRSCRAID